MKLLSCYIENFGKLNNYTYNFESGLNSIIEENGWGKTTFATFIKAMFYGLPSSSKRNIEENERKKYTPWQSGNFGGYLEFETNNKQYRITRFFGKKDSEDTFELKNISTGKLSKDFSTNVGLELFGLDSDAYERSTFIPQKSLDGTKNESLTNKLTNLIQGTSDDSSLTKALEIIEKRRAELHKTNNKTGLIEILDAEISEISEKISELETKANSIGDIQGFINSEDEKIESTITLQNGVKEKIKKYAEIQEKIANIENVKKQEKICNDLKNEMSDLNKILNGANTTLVEIEDYSIKNKSLNKKQTSMETILENSSSEKLEALLEYFNGEKNIPSEECIKEYNEKNIKYLTLKNETEKVEVNNIVSKQTNKSLFLLIPSILLFVLGGILISISLVPAIISFVLGFICLMICGFLYFKNMIESKTSTTSNIDYNLLKDKQIELLRLENELKLFINKFENNYVDFLSALNTISAKINEYKMLKNLSSRNIKDADKLKAEIDNLDLEVKSFLSQFVFDSSLSTNDEKLEKIKNTLIELSKLEQKYEASLKDFEQLKKDKNYSVDEKEFDNIDIETLQEQDQKYQNEIDNYKETKTKHVQQISKIQDEISILDELESEKDNKLLKKQEYEKELNIIKHTKAFLSNASDSLSSKFLQPMKDGLKKYLKIITEEKFENIDLDTDLKITFEEFGKSRELDYLSKGYKNVVDLCMRFSLIESLFEKEKPFIVLDDPFINMDKQKIENAITLLNNVAKDYQIIYFVCHESRV